MSAVEVYRHWYWWTLLKTAWALPFVTLLWSILGVFAVVVVGWWIDRRWVLLFYDPDTAPWMLGAVASAVLCWLLGSTLWGMFTQRVTLDWDRGVVRFEGMAWWPLGEGESGPWFRAGRRRALELPMAGILAVETYWRTVGWTRRRWRLRVLAANVVVDIPWELGRMQRLAERLESIAARTPAAPERATKRYREGMIVAGAKLAWVIGLVVVTTLIVPWLMS